MLLDLNYKNPKDRVIFRKIIKLVDIDNKKIAVRANVTNFFSLPNFLEMIAV